MHQAEWTHSGGHPPLLVLTFSEPTNTPCFGDAAALNNAITFNSGNLRLEAGFGNWSSDGQALTIAGVDRESWAVATASIASGTFHAIPRTTLRAGGIPPLDGRRPGRCDAGSPIVQLRGNYSFPVSSAAQLLVDLYVGEKPVATSAGTENIATSHLGKGTRACTEHEEGFHDPHDWDGFGSSGTSRAGEYSGGAPMPRPSYSVEGVLAMPADAWLEASRQRSLPVLDSREERLVVVANRCRHARSS